METKKYILVDSQVSIIESKPTPQTDWSACILCQQSKDEPFQCPANSKRSDAGAGYTTLGENLLKFSELKSLPFNIDRLDEGEGIVKTITHHKAKWHKNCGLQYNTLKLQRKQNDLKRKSTDSCNNSDSPSSKRFTRQSPHASKVHDSFECVCFFCETEGTETNKLHEVETFPLDQKIRESALKLQDEKLLAKLSAGDCVALEAKYHLTCLQSLYNKVDRITKISTEDVDYNALHSVALAEVIEYIEVARSSSEVAPVFKLADLAKLYEQKLTSLGVSVSSRTHTTRLKERILCHFPDLQEHIDGRGLLLAFDSDVSLAIRKVCDDYDEEGVHLTKAAKIIRKEMLSMKSSFAGSFNVGCQEASIPTSLLSLVRMILDGTSTKQGNIDDNDCVPQTALSISQLLFCNSHIRRREGSCSTIQSTNRETPLQVYLGLMIHAKTRKKELVETLHELGLSISYARVLAISTNEGNRACNQFKSENAVCPMKLKSDLLTGGAIDNVDHDPSSTTAQDSFHGTSISLLQQPTLHNEGRSRERVEFESNSTTLQPLPATYTDVPPLIFRNKEPEVPAMDGTMNNGGQKFNDASQEEKKWLAEVKDVLEDENAEPGEKMVSWAAYHASKQPENAFLDGISTLLPLFHEDSKSPAMISHSMNIVRDAVAHLNPGQVPFVTLDQPLYAIAKKLQWDYPEVHGEDKYVVLLGGLHIEMTMLKCLGDWLNESGWTNALVQAKIASSGKADSFLKAAHVTRTRHAHQVTASCLYILLNKAYNQYKDSSIQDEDDVMSLDEWVTQMIQQSPTVQFWYTTLTVELLLLVYVRSIREGDFKLYVESLTKIAPWMFALDHTHYARWLSVHIRDMDTLEQAHPSLYEEFMNGHFVFHKTQRQFSAMALDQAHEQNNALVKGDGGAVGLTESPSALARWMIAGPEIARIVSEFEESAGIGLKKQSKQHHEQSKSVQSSFVKEVRSLVAVFEEFGNPFLEMSSDLIVLDSKEIADSAIVETVREVESIGQKQYNDFVLNRLKERKVTLYETIKRNKLPLFHCPPARTKSKSQLQVQSLKSDCSLFSRLYIACQTRGGSLEQFFEYENQAAPPAISHLGKLQPSTKANLLPVLEKMVPEGITSIKPTVDAKVIEGSVAVRFLEKGKCETFNDYAVNKFTPYVMGHLKDVSRLDIVWDIYIPNSLKACTRAKRGQGKRRRVTPAGPLPGDWTDFLKNDVNKQELFQFLASHLAKQQIPEGKQLFLTFGDSVLSNPDADTSNMTPCSQEEGDTRVFIHVRDAVRNGHQKVSIRTVDTDVLVLAVSLAYEMEDAELWLAFGTGKDYRYIPAHEIAHALGTEKATALPYFHALTGCDTVSGFFNHSKTNAWNTWLAYPEITGVFCALSSSPQEISEDQLASLERFIVIMYDRTSSESSVNACRKKLFIQKDRQIMNIPPTQGALYQHILRATFQAGHVWGQCLVLQPDLPEPSEWGWSREKVNEPWQPMWTLLPQATKSCRELIQCQCQKGCRRSRGCSCAKVQLKCTALCKCSGECTQL